MISLNDYELSVKSGEEVTVPVQLVRSERFKKGKIDGIILQKRTGIESEIVRDAENQDLYELTIKVSPGMNPGTFPLILKAEGRSAYKVKQTMIMLTVVTGQQVVSNNR